MEQNQYVEYLLHFGLTRQEALIYVELLVKGKQTGYEIAKETGISRSNVYSVLAALAEKGAAYVIEESAKRYIPVKVEEFCGNCIRRMQEEQEWMERNLPQKKAETEGYITIEGEQNILDKAKNLIAQAGERVYLSCTAGYLVDSKSVLSGEYGKGSLNTCLYSGQKNFVTVFKNAMANEIKLIQLQKGGTVL